MFEGQFAGEITERNGQRESVPPAPQATVETVTARDQGQVCRSFGAFVFKGFGNPAAGLDGRAQKRRMIACNADLSGSVLCWRRDGSLPLDNSCSSATRPRATRLLIVPTAQPQISAASS